MIHLRWYIHQTLRYYLSKVLIHERGYWNQHTTHMKYWINLMAIIKSYKMVWSVAQLVLIYMFTVRGEYKLSNHHDKSLRYHQTEQGV